MAASNRFVNITSTTWTSGNTNTTITTVTGASIAKRSQEVQSSGDGDFFPTLSVTVGSAPQVTIQHQNAALLSTINERSVGTLSFVGDDAVNGAGSGAVTVTLANANVSSHEFGFNHKAVGTGTLVVSAHSTDGTTSPLSYTIAP